jgi:hypothetical protein
MFRIHGCTPEERSQEWVRGRGSPSLPAQPLLFSSLPVEQLKVGTWIRPQKNFCHIHEFPLHRHIDRRFVNRVRRRRGEVHQCRRGEKTIQRVYKLTLATPRIDPSLPKFCGTKLMRAEKQEKVKNGYDALTPDIG